MAPPPPDSSQPPQSQIDSLQFQTVQPADTRPQCTQCSTAINDQYYHLGGQVICLTCANRAENDQRQPKNTWLMRGALYGFGAAVACSIGYALVSWFTNMEFALLSILVGYAVGRAVRIGSHGLGGRACQVIAVALTYFAITASYVPLIVKASYEMAEKAESKAAAEKKASPASDAPSATGILAFFALIFGLAFVAPVLNVTEGFSGLIGVAIIFFGLSKAWQQTARDERLLMGPYSTVEPPPPAPAA